MKKILITGGAGFIGYHLTKQLVESTDASLTLVDNLQRGRIDADMTELLARASSRITFLTADLTNPDTFRSFDRDFDHVYHLAAVNGTKHFYNIPHEVLRINTLSLVYMLEWIRGIEKKPKLLFTSSNEAYAGALDAFGQLPIPTPEPVPLLVSDPYNPRWTYAGTKLIGEQFVIHYAAQFKFPAVIVRPHNFYGPRAGFDHVIPEFIARVTKRVDPFPIYGSDDTRTFCFITDAVKAMHLAMESEKTNGHPIETLHIGNTDELTMRELAERIFSLMEWKPTSLDIHPSPAGSVKRRLADISKIERLLDWKPETSLDEGLRETISWYQKNL